MVQKTINDYYEQIFTEYPTIPKRDIKRILQFGYKSLYLLNSYGCDVVAEKGKFWIYCGRLFRNALDHYNYYKKKLKTKLRVIYKRNRAGWDGYYYFSLNQKQYDLYKSQIKRRGRPKKKFTFNNIVLRKLYEECLVTDTSSVAIFRVPMLGDVGFDRFCYTFTTSQAELVTEKKTSKMKEIMPYYHDYEILKNKKYKK